ncbi:MAG: putative LPS assembly protein LptD [Chitinophagales bacterium]
MVWLQNVAYTTCTNVDHPHFYLGAKRSKVVPGKIMVTGPVNLVVFDVHTPLYLPFGIFPTKNGRRSGIVMP